MEHIEYTRTVVPSSMRSPYWKYFGFPSDSGNNILTRQKIVCTICNTAIAYNKNTSNLRTHLMSKHVEIFQKLVMTSNDLSVKQDDTVNEKVEEQMINAKERFTMCYPPSINTIKAVDIKKRRTEEPTLESNNNLDQSYLTIPEYGTNLEAGSSIHAGHNCSALSNKVDIEVQKTDYIGYIPSNGSSIVEITETTVEDLPSAANIDDSKNEQLYAYNDIEFHEQQLHSMDIMLADMVQTDLLPLDILGNQGFCKYSQQLTGVKMDPDTVKRVMKVIQTRYINTNQIITSHVVRLSQTQPYSLSIEIYSDNDGQNVMNIYYNYLSDNHMDLISILYKSSTICTKPFHISELLTDIDLKNCSGVVVPCIDNMFDFVLEFTKCHDLPIIECLESMLTRSLHKIFEQSDISEDYEKLLKLMLENPSLTYKKNPIIRPQSLWNRLNYLENIFKNEVLEQCGDMRRIYDYIKPLKMALDIIKDENLPLCSLTRPLIIKLFEEHFSSINSEQEFLKIFKIQKILQKELHERIMAQRFLNEATFFDTRFHGNFALQEPDFDITKLKTQVLARFKNILHVTYINKSNNMKIEQNSEDSLLNFRKCSSLKLFFKRDVYLTNTEITTELKTNLDLELEQYQTEACLDLDQSPALWWQQQSDNYKQLSHVAKHYLTIPCCCLPRLCRIDLEQRYSILNRRKYLSQFCHIESKLWYLYYNEAVSELI